MTALTYMAAPARPPGISDARVPCPLCGGLIHPVAGRCKHCKETLAQFRSGRAAAATPLPALHGNGHAAVTAVPIAIDKVESQPVLPPRPTGRSAAVRAPRSSVLRSWPVLVIILALLAIGTAVVLMMWPPNTADEGKHALQPPPAPERMETNPLPPAGSTDPWSAPHSQADPHAIPRPTPDTIPIDPKPDDDDNVFGGITGGATFGGTAATSFMLTELDHACRKLKTCPDVDQTMLTTACDLVSSMPKQTAPSCDAAKRCLDAIDNMSCSQSGFANPTSVIMMFQDCTTASTRC